MKSFKINLIICCSHEKDLSQSTQKGKNKRINQGTSDNLIDKEHKPYKRKIRKSKVYLSTLLNETTNTWHYIDEHS